MKYSTIGYSGNTHITWKSATLIYLQLSRRSSGSVSKMLRALVVQVQTLWTKEDSTVYAEVESPSSLW